MTPREIALALGGQVRGRDTVLAPGPGHSSRDRSLEPDRDQIEIFVDAIFRHAGNEGYISLRSFLNNNKVLKPIQTVKLNGANRVYLIDVAEDQARRAANNPEPAVFCPPLAVFNGETGWQAREADLFKGLTISVECDERPDEARTRLEEILGPTTAVVRSGGQWIDPKDGAAFDKLHLHWRLAAPAMDGALGNLKCARELATTIVGGDPSNIPAVHCLRWPGGWHRKGPPRLCELVGINPDAEIDLETALAALKAAAPPEATKPNGRVTGEQTNPEDWGTLAGDIVAGRNLHLSILRLAGKYVRAGMSSGAAVNQLRGLMQISQAKHERPDDWQTRYDDIPRLVESAEVGQEEKTTSPLAKACALDTVVAVFDEWLALKDKTPLYAMLGSVAANLLEGDPVWLGIIAPPSSAKTELLNSLSRLPYVVVAEALSPAALLSGTSKKQRAKKATGGLLVEMGQFGILAFKDFGTVLDMRAETRAEMLSALRRIFDGEYVRQIGADGGRTLSWRGKSGLVFAATQKYDLYHVVIGTLGDRFLLVRLDPTGDEQFDMCFKHVGRATKNMREQLAEAVAGLFAGLPDPLPEPKPLAKPELAKLKDTVMLATRLRAGVERDRIKRDIEAVYDPEGPARLALALERLFAGLVIIGLDRQMAMQVVETVAMDSTPRFRLAVYTALSDEWKTTRKVAGTVNLPTTTTRRALEDLTAQGLALREEKGAGADEWKLAPKNDGH
jgi:hypothetical protein